MSVEVQLKAEALATRYNLSAQTEWRQFINHFDFAASFALVVLLVADADGADLCRAELEKQLQRENRKLLSLDVSTLEALRNLPSRLLATRLPTEAGGLWIAAVAADYSKDFAVWREAWRFALAGLNPRRNEIRRQFSCSLIFVGAPWLQEIMREIAPDLWSVRTLVTRIDPRAAIGTNTAVAQSAPFGNDETKAGSDPRFALQEAGKLRGVPGKELALARLLHRAGEGFATQDDWSAAEKVYTEALAIKQKFGAPPESLIDTLFNLSWTSQVLGQVRRSLDYAQSALVLARQTGNRINEGNALGNLGLAYAVLGETRKAIELYEQALVVTRETGLRHGEGQVLGNLGNAYFALGELPRAIECHEQQLLIAHETGNQQAEGNALGNLGSIYLALGNPHKAVEFFERALIIIRRLGDKQAEGTVIGNLGLAYVALGEVPKGIEFYERRLAIAREIGDKRGEGSVLGNLGILYANMGDQHKAVEFYEQQLEIARATADKYGESKSLWNSAVALHDSGERARAIARAEAALKIFEAIEDPNVAKARAALANWRGQP